jgi:hypothetical protein
MRTLAVCSHCGSNWSKGEFDPHCPECGGGALERACPACGGACGSRWRRAVLDSNDAGVAHWIGQCLLTRSGPQPK